MESNVRAELAKAKRRRAQAASRYQPESIRLLMIAESPPAATDRYFYFEDVTGQDSLWVETMKALYPHEFGRTADERARNADWLGRFRDDGCFLADAVKDPLEGPTRARVAAIRARASKVVAEIQSLDPAALLLIKATVWEGLQTATVDAGLPLVNGGPIPFPGSGQQRRFHEQIERLGVRELLRSSDSANK